MYRVVGYDYHIDNKEEMKMESIRIEDVHFDQSAVSVNSTVLGGGAVYLDFDPDGYGYCQTLMNYTPDQARKLAAALILAAEEAENQVCKYTPKYNGEPCHSASAHDRKVAVCYHSGGNGFINGCEYEYEVDECDTDSKPRVIHIVQDAFVSDLQGGHRWRALKVGSVMNANDGKLGEAYAIANPDGGVVAQFYIK